MARIGTEHGRAGQGEELLGSGPQTVHGQCFLLGPELAREEDLVLFHPHPFPLLPPAPPFPHPHHRGPGGRIHKCGDPFEEEPFDGRPEVLRRVIEDREPHVGAEGEIYGIPLGGDGTHHLLVHDLLDCEVLRCT